MDAILQCVRSNAELRVIVCTQAPGVRVLSRIYRLGGEVPRGRSPEWPKARSFLGGGGGILVSPEIFSNEYAVRCNLIHFETQLWETFQYVHWPRRVWLIFPMSYLYTVMITTFFRGKLDIWGAGSLYPSNNQDRSLGVPHPPISPVLQLCTSEMSYLLANAVILVHICRSLHEVCPLSLSPSQSAVSILPQ